MAHNRGTAIAGYTGLAGMVLLCLLAGAHGQAITGYRLQTLPPSFFGSHEPSINNQTDNLHYFQHHGAARNALNAALFPNFTFIAARYATLTNLLMDLGTGRTGLPPAVETTVRNQGGSVWNHAMFWRVMTSRGSRDASTSHISRDFRAAITRAFGSLENMAMQLNTTGQRQFGSGWSFLVWNRATGLQVCGFANQDNPLMSRVINPSTCQPYANFCSGIPIFGIDVWEHTYYLKFFNRRADFLDSFLRNNVNWRQVNANFVAAQRGAFAEIISVETELPVLPIAV